MNQQDALIFLVEIESLADAHRRRGEEYRRRAAILLNCAERHTSHADRLTATAMAMEESPWTSPEGPEAKALRRNFVSVFGRALTAADEMMGLAGLESDDDDLPF